MEHKVALVSGGTAGIGKAVVRRLLGDGFCVATFSRDERKVEALAQELAKEFPQERFLAMRGDVGSDEDTRGIVERTIARFSRIDILVHNAGAGYWSAADDVDMARVEEMLRTNLFGPMLLTRHALPHMKREGHGTVVLLASISGKVAYAKGEFYSASKFALMGYADGLRKELAPSGIKVCTVCPGMVETEFFPPGEIERRSKEWKGGPGPMLAPEDVARVVSLVASQSARCDIQDITLMPSG